MERTDVKTIVVADLYGLGGKMTSPGMLSLADKIRALGKNFIVLGPYDQSQWNCAATDLANRPKTDLLAAVGYSLGANNVVAIANTVGREVSYLAGIQPSYWGMGVGWSGQITLPENVFLSLCVYNPTWAATVGLGFARYVPKKASILHQLRSTTDSHPAVDNDVSIHGMILADLKSLDV